MKYKNEKEVGKQAERMLEASLRRRTAGFVSHYRGAEPPDAVSMRSAKAKATVKAYGRVKAGAARYFMRKLSIQMARHGFIQHYGVDTTREGGERTRHIPREKEYTFKSHAMRMKARPFLDDVVTESGVVDFVLEQLMRIRGEK